MKTQYSSKCLENVDTYIAHYRRYFLDLYSDTGLGESEKIIRSRYNTEAKLRHREIIELIEKRLTPDIVLGRTLVDSLILPWRSKTIFVSWEDSDDTRRITDLSIR